MKHFFPSISQQNLEKLWTSCAEREFISRTNNLERRMSGKVLELEEILSDFFSFVAIMWYIFFNITLYIGDVYI